MARTFTLLLIRGLQVVHVDIGFCAELGGAFFYIPADCVTQRLQVQSRSGFHHNSRLYKGPIDVLKKIINLEGVRGLYRGYGAYVSSFAPSSAVQWGTYETSKAYFSQAVDQFENTYSFRISRKSEMVNACSAGLASVTAITFSNPFEIMRIRTQLLEVGSKRDADILKQGYFKLAARIFREEGWMAFYRGLSLRIGTTVPSAIVALTGYEVVKQWAI
jgi:hypothetical protein